MSSRLFVLFEFVWGDYNQSYPKLSASAEGFPHWSYKYTSIFLIQALVMIVVKIISKLQWNWRLYGVIINSDVGTPFQDFTPDFAIIIMRIIVIFMMAAMIKLQSYCRFWSNREFATKPPRCASLFTSWEVYLLKSLTTMTWTLGFATYHQYMIIFIGIWYYMGLSQLFLCVFTKQLEVEVEWPSKDSMPWVRCDFGNVFLYFFPVIPC